jgi:hypothetical protein
MTERFEQLVSDCRGMTTANRIMRAMDAMPADADLMHWLDVAVHLQASLRMAADGLPEGGLHHAISAMDDVIDALEDASIEGSAFDEDEEAGATYDDSLFAAERRALLRGFGG